MTYWKPIGTARRIFWLLNKEQTYNFDFGFAIGLSAKDNRLCLEESERLGVPLRVGDAVRGLLNATRDKYGEQADMTEIIRYIEDEVGVQVRGKATGTI